MFKGIPLLWGNVARSLSYQFTFLFSWEHLLGCDLLKLDTLLLRGNGGRRRMDLLGERPFYTPATAGGRSSILEKRRGSQSCGLGGRGRKRSLKSLELLHPPLHCGLLRFLIFCTRDIKG